MEDDVIMLDRICKDNNIIQTNSEDDPYAVMEAEDYCGIHGCDDDMFEDDDQLVYVDDIDVAHPLNIVKHIRERFYKWASSNYNKNNISAISHIHL